AGVADRVVVCVAPGFAPGSWATGLAPVVAREPAVVLPASPDGRDLAPRLAAELDRPLYAGAVAVAATRIDIARHGGRSIERVVVRGPFVATLQPGVRGVDTDPERAAPQLEFVDLEPGPAHDAEVLDVLAPDAATVDLAEARRIIAGGGGLDGPDRLGQLADVARAINASVGATRVVTDRGWLDHHRQIGTTGVAVDPRLYVALAISGAVQHVNGIGAAEHVVSVNTDPHCPMMALAHLAIVCDANALLDELVGRVGAGDG
ncbi:MAG: mycofactocin-associated electron transfer flavoprotein alpha subunit, partial [Acidimicrobiales bacterium]